MTKNKPHKHKLSERWCLVAHEPGEGQCNQCATCGEYWKPEQALVFQ